MRLMDNGVPRDMSGIHSPRTKIKHEGTVHNLCRTLQDKPHLSKRQVAARHGQSFGVVDGIVKGKTWKHISCQYNFTARLKYWGKFNKTMEKI